MLDFVFYTPTKVVFGKNAESRVGELVEAHKCKKVLVHYGGNSAKASGLLDRVFRSLTEHKIAYVSLGGVVPNPRLSKVYEGIELCRREGVDFILAVGGGSVIDSSKAISYGLANSFDVWDLFAKKAKAQAFMPLGVVLTIAAAGSEMSNSTVITNEDGWLKRGCNDDICRPVFAVMNPELTYSLPAYQTMSGCTDILMHTLERYFTAGDTMDMTDVIAEGLLRTVMQNALILLDDPHSYKARAEIMWASSLSHNGLTGCGAAGDWVSHKLEHELGGMFDVAHGAGLAAVWSSWARYVYKTNPARFAQFAVRVMDIPADAGDDNALSLKGIEAMEAFFHKIGMPVRVSEMGIALTDAQIDEMAEKAFAGSGVLYGFRKIGQEDMRNIYLLARA